MPVFAQAREKARAATCVSNLKQIGLASAAYIQDYDGTFFPPHQPLPGPPWAKFFPLLLYPYIKHGAQDPNVGGVFECPSAPRTGGGAGMARGYCLRILFIRNPSIGWMYDHICNESEVTTPAEKLFITDCGTWPWGAPQHHLSHSRFRWCNHTTPPIAQALTSPLCNGVHQPPLNADCDDCTGTDPPNCYAQIPRYRHHEGVNVLFMDWHVKWRKKGTLHWGKELFMEWHPDHPWY
ncbi:MAG: DUF1559 domain-containing protein [Abditibacteriales bacterium]|nr:DUF1559 domain-containing protein [Abditibacteriales bacterium]